MKTLVKFNKNNETVSVSTQELLNAEISKELRAYLEVSAEYELFCKNQTKRGQSRKNERGAKRRSMFAKFDNDKMVSELIEVRNSLEKIKNDEIEKIEVEIEYDGRKKSNLGRIISGVRMAIFVGGISPQYRGIGLINYRIL